MSTATRTPARAGGSTFPALIERSHDRLAAVLPAGCRPERFMKTALVEFSRNPDLANCRPDSVLIAVMQAAELGLEVGKPMDLAHLVPFKAECQLLIDYKGFLALARRSGEFRLIDARLVRERDRFEFEYSPDLLFIHKPFTDGEGGPIRGAYAFVKLLNGETVIEWMTVQELEHIRSLSRSKESPAWRNHLGEMYRKIPLKRLLKRQARTVEIATAAAIDDAEYADGPTVVVRQDRGVGALTDKLRGRLPAPEPEFTTDEGVGQPLRSEADEPCPDELEREPGED